MTRVCTQLPPTEVTSARELKAPLSGKVSSSEKWALRLAVTYGFQVEDDFSMESGVERTPEEAVVHVSPPSYLAIRNEQMKLQFLAGGGGWQLVQLASYRGQGPGH